MENKGYIEIHIEGLKGQMPLSPGNYDISELRGLLDRAEQLLFPALERKNRPVVSYEIKDGSVRHIFKTSLQAIIGFNAVLGLVADKRAIDFLEYPTAKAFYALQETARKKTTASKFPLQYRVLPVSTSIRQPIIPCPTMMNII